MAQKTRSVLEATKFAAKANGMLALAQIAFGATTGNFGFIEEAGHNLGDAGAFTAKAEAMNANCSDKKAKRLRRLGASIILAGASFGAAGGIIHLTNDTTESSGYIEIAGAVIGAAVNTEIARRSHGSIHAHDHNQPPHDHHSGASHDSKLHIAGDVATGWLYAGSLSAEHIIPGITNYTLLVNAAIMGSIGVKTLSNINKT